MGKSPLILAALAKDAVPELDFTKVEELVTGGSGRDFEVALLTSRTGDHYVLREPKSNAGLAKIAIELAVSKALNAMSGLSFKVSSLVGETRDPRVAKAYLFTYVYGQPIDPHSIAPNGNLPTRIGEVLAEIHSLPTELVEANGLPQYSVNEVLKSRVAELDQAVATGRIPAVLANRWEKALEDVSIFRFNPTVVHGEMSGEHILSLDDSVESVMSWSSLRVSDPAEDFAWLMTGTDDDVLYQVMLAYSARRPASDQNLRVRAMLYSELLVARWLLHGQRLGDEGIVEEALDMLDTLVEDIAEGRVPALSPAEIQASRAAEPAFEPMAGNAFLAEAESPVSTNLFIAESEAVSSPVFEVSDKTRPIEIIDIDAAERAEAAESIEAIELPDYDYEDGSKPAKPASDELF